MSPSRHWLQFRLRDLFALVTLLAIVLAIGLPYLKIAREQARNEACKNTLRSIGVALHAFANADPRGRYSTGKSDYLDTGCPDTVGWMADVISTDPLLRGKLMCPTNPTVGWEGVNDLYTGGTGVASPIAQTTAGFCGASNWKSAVAGPGPDFAGSLPNTPERASLVARATWGSGINTNYTPSWFLTDSAPRYAWEVPVVFEPLSRNARIVTAGLKGQSGLWRTSMSQGPLTRRLLEGGVRPTSIVPLLGDGAATGRLAFPMEFGQKLSNGGGDPLRDGTHRQFARRGSSLVPATNRGPAKWNPIAKQLDWIAGGDDLTEQIEAERPRRSPLRLDAPFIQDTRGWRAEHAISGKAYCNLLMADGSVISVEDKNGDGFLNPGFAIPLGLSEEEYSRIGYRDGVIELNSIDVFSGVFIQDLTRYGPE